MDNWDLGLLMWHSIHKGTFIQSKIKSLIKLCAVIFYSNTKIGAEEKSFHKYSTFFKVSETLEQQQQKIIITVCHSLLSCFVGLDEIVIKMFIVVFEKCCRILKAKLKVQFFFF